MVCVNLGESREFTRETHAKRDDCQSLTAHFACHNWKACSHAQGAVSQSVSSSFYNANDASLFPVEQGWRSGESTCLPPVWPGFESWRRRHMWAEFVVGFLHCSERVFCGYSSFPFP